MSTTFGLHRAVLFDRDGVATLFEDRKRSWAEVADRVARLGGALKELGVGRGDRVAILMLNQDRYLELYLAIAWAGAVVVPLNIRWTAAGTGLSVDRGRSFCSSMPPSRKWANAKALGALRCLADDVLSAARRREPTKIWSCRADSRRRNRSRRHFLYWRDDGTLEGRDAEPPQSAGERPQCAADHG
jgi:acyl-CoA synthetase (AMP-forming)/AMP-acid ligase II